MPDQQALPRAVAAALGRDVVALDDVRREPVVYDAFLAHRSLVRVRGTALLDDGTRTPWSVVEKRSGPPGTASPYLVDNARREAAAYGSGLLDRLPAGVRAPRLLAAEHEGGATALWLEDVAHAGPRPLDGPTLVAVARDLGAVAGTWLGRVPVEPWLFRGWVDRHAQPEAVPDGLAVLDRALGTAAARDVLGRARTEEVRGLVLAQPRVRALLDGAPQTFCHHDAVGSNVLRPDAGTTVLVDWEQPGPGPVGADLVGLLFSSARRGDALTTTVVQAWDEAVEAYLAGLRDAAGDRGGHDRPHDLDDRVRRAVDAAVALRWKLAVDVVASGLRGEVPRRGSLPDEPPGRAATELAGLVDVLLGAARRALGG